jgi:hypothetical protein
MGMFDDIYCRYKLPDGSVDFWDQTKEFACVMAKHEITEDGRLLLDEGHYIDTPEDQLPYKDHPSPLMRMCGIITWVPDKKESNYTGSLWVGDYVLWFVDGRVKDVAPAKSATSAPAPESVAAEPNELEDVETGEAKNKEEIDG